MGDRGSLPPDWQDYPSLDLLAPEEEREGLAQGERTVARIIVGTAPTFGGCNKPRRKAHTHGHN